jgi:ATP-dependent Lon protease
MEENGLAKTRVEIPRETLQQVIEQYTREAGVRNLEREIGNVCRKIARQVVIDEKPKELFIPPENLHSYLGVQRFKAPEGFSKGEIGTANGLAWTETGGELLQIEVALIKGRGALQITGQLGEVMQESAKAALTCVRSRAVMLGIDEKFNKTTDLHIHVPEGAIPKDGPSAGLCMATALTSALTGIPVRSDVAMTGEITLRGRALKIGGVKEKTLAAFRAGIKEVILPRDNEKDMIEEVPPEVKEAVRFHFVDNLDQVLAIALERPIAALPLKPVVDGVGAHSTPQ